MHRERFQDQLCKSFIGYAGILVAAALLLYLGSCLVNYYVVVVQGNRTDNSHLAQVLTEQMDAYTLELEQLSTADVMLQAVTQGDSHSRTEANRCLYAFANAQNMRPYFVLMNRNREIVCSNFSYINQQIFSESTFALGVITRMQHNPDEIILSVTEGLGDRLVDGSVSGSTYTVNGSNITCRGKAILSEKHLQLILAMVREVSRKADASARRF